MLLAATCESGSAVLARLDQHRLAHPVGFAIRPRFHEHCYDFIAARNRFAMSPLPLLGHVTPSVVRGSGAVLLYKPPQKPKAGPCFDPASRCPVLPTNQKPPQGGLAFMFAVILATRWLSRSRY
jgi:hypothetical protein